MTATNIRIAICHGASLVSDVDRQRALRAAVAVLGDTDPAEAYAEYMRQIEVIGDTEDLTGLAALWHRVQAAADIALTDGWRDSAGAYCEVVLA